MSDDNTSPRKPQAPFRTFRAGSVRAAVWQNQVQRDGNTVVEHTIRINRRYQKDGQWTTTEIFFPEQLLQVAAVAHKVYDSIAIKETERETDDLPV
jgi:hypothetical protein